ncbi:hypothetical protein [Archangium sp.]|uniref:hypothetical protein n=1 Tax=Archangium sp. TaxID=1872627 RepID=UPI00286AEFCF|nr:hypothetical protein [Archangium sp.]
MRITIAPSSAQLELNTSMTLNVSGGTAPYTWSASVPTGNGTYPVTPSSGMGTSCTITGQYFGVVTVTVTDSSTPKATATVPISVGSVIIASPDGNYYRCFPSGATVTLPAADNASKVFGYLGASNVFGDATGGKIDRVTAAVKNDKANSTDDPASATAVTCYLLNLPAIKP